MLKTKKRLKIFSPVLADTLCSGIAKGVSDVTDTQRRVSILLLPRWVLLYDRLNSSEILCTSLRVPSHSPHRNCRDTLNSAKSPKKVISKVKFNFKQKKFFYLLFFSVFLKDDLFDVIKSDISLNVSIKIMDYRANLLFLVRVQGLLEAFLEQTLKACTF